MPKGHNNKGRSTKDARHVRLYHSMLRGDAWLSLSTQSRAVYIELERRYNGSNNGQIRMSTREAATLCRINKDTATKAFRELVAKGFIKRRKRGHFDYKQNHASEWELTAHQVGDNIATRDFQKWRPEKNHGPKQGTKCPKPRDAKQENAFQAPRVVH